MIINVFQSTVGFLSRSLINLLIILIMSFFLDGHNLGVILIAFTWSQITTLIVEYGFQIYTYNKLNRVEGSVYDEVFSSSLTLKNFLLVINFALFLLLIKIYPSNFVVFFFVFLSFIFNSYTNFFLIYFRSKGEFMKESKCIFRNNLLVLVCVGLASITLNVIIVAFAIFASRFLYFIYIYNKEFKGRVTIRGDISNIYIHMKESSPYALLTVVGILYVSMDSLLLSFYLSPEEVGAYSLALQTVLATCFLSNAIGSVSLREVTIKYSLLRVFKLSIFSLFVGFAVSLVFIFISPLFYSVLFPVQFVYIEEIIPWLSILILIRYTISPFGSVMTALGYNWLRVIVNALSIMLVAFTIIYSECGLMESAVIANIYAHSFMFLSFFAFIMYLKVKV